MTLHLKQGTNGSLKIRSLDMVDSSEEKRSSKITFPFHLLPEKLLALVSCTIGRGRRACFLISHCLATSCPVVFPPPPGVSYSMSFEVPQRTLVRRKWGKIHFHYCTTLSVCRLWLHVISHADVKTEDVQIYM